MAVQNNEVYHIWIMRITLATTLIVVSLSWINAVSIPNIIVRGGVSFGAMYLLMAGSLSLFEKTASHIPQNEQQISSDADCGGVIDFSVGDDEFKPELQPSSLPGQVDPSLSKGLPGSKQQAEIVRRMGWE